MRIVAISCIGPNERHLTAALDDIARLKPDEVIIACNNTDPATEREIRKRGFGFYRDDREWGKEQPYIKGDLLRRAGRLNPDWILAKDADELYDPALTREGLEELAAKGGIGWYFYIVNLWGDPEHYHRGLSFWNIRFYKYVPELGLEFQKTPVHCGWAPPMAYRWGNYAPYMHLHYGLMDERIRAEKMKRYELYDPNAKYKDRTYYDALKDDKVGAPLNRDELRAKINHEVLTYKVKGIPQTQKEPEGYCYMTKGDRTIDVPYKDARRYERMGWALASRINLHKNGNAEAPVVKAEEPTEPKADEAPTESDAPGKPGVGAEVPAAAPQARRTRKPK